MICISKTRTNITNLKLINLSMYNFYNNNSTNRAGGSGIYVSKSLSSKELIDLRMNLPDCEDVWVEISTGKRDTIVIASIYRHPKQNVEKFIQMLKTRLCVINMSKKLTLLGDFNIDYSNYKKLKTIKDNADTIISAGFEQLTSYAKRDSLTRQSILDYVYV